MTVGLALVAAAILLPSDDAAATGGRDAVDYARDVKPILAKHCVACHGPLWQRGGLRLDTAQLAHRGGDSGTAIDIAHPTESTLLQAVEGRGDYERMPKDAPPLADNEIALLRRWIAAGAVAPPEKALPSPRDHWAFKPIRRPPVPAFEKDSHPIDAFIRAKQRENGLQTVEAADPATLCRRIYFDLTGLPPTPAEVADFVSACHVARPGPTTAVEGATGPLDDGLQAATAALADRLLAQPQHGERWGRHWMDVWRYSDWYGFQAEVRGSAKHIWHWRDWIIESLNADEPYDRMVRLMLAADELEPTNPKSLRATGYLVRSWHRFNRNVWLDDAIEHSGKAFLGLTLNCARCHDHKYDPVTHEEYYHFRAYFEPHDIRTDPINGIADQERDGLARTYDKELAPATYLLERGDEARPKKDRALGPRLPAFFGKAPAPAVVALPAAAHLPILDPAYAKSLRDKLVRKEGQAAKDLAVAKTPAERKSRQSQLHHAQLELAAFDARIAAERARHSGRSDATLARKAAVAEANLDAARAEAAIADLEAKLAQAPSPVATLAQLVATGKPKRPVAAAELQKQLAEAKSNLQKARQRAGGADDKYQPVGPIYPDKSSGRRLALAQWITAPDNPLFARVAVNHIWMRHMGAPLVDSVFDFGVNGRPPSHPELLDWLASELIAGGWKMKRIHRLIVASRAYQRASSAASLTPALRADNVRIDPDNRLLWRANSRRLEAEAVRDAVLAVAGRLDATLGGPDIDQRQDDASQRRSLYLRHAKEKQSTFLTTFDAANSTECYRRIQTVAPQQALALSNGKLVDDSSREIARMVTTATTRHGMPSDGAFVLAAFERLLGRAARDDEFELCMSYLAKRGRRDASTARESLIRVLFNHTDFVTVH